MSQAGEIDVINSNPQIPTMFITDVGTAIPIANELNVFGAGGIVTSGAGNTITITGGATIATTYTANVGSATPALNNINLLGASVAALGIPVETVASGSTLTLNVQRSSAALASLSSNAGIASFDSSQFVVDINGFVSLVGGGSAIEKINLQTGTTPIVPTGGFITLNGATVAAGTNPVRTDGTGVSTAAIEIQITQAIAATDATKIGLAAFDSAVFSVDASGFVTLKGGGEAIDSIGVDATSGTGTNPVLPTVAGLITVNGAVVAAGTNPIRTVSTLPNTYQIQNQISQAIASTDVTKIGLANFDSAAFDVDANGFVQLNGGGIAATSFTVDANTAPGTNPVVPTASGGVTIEAAAVAAHSVPIETRSRAANTFKVEVQEAAAVAATDATKSGISHFNSAQFSVDANGFVSTSGTGIANTITGDSGGALSPTAGNWNILGLSGSKTSGSGSTLTVKSPPYADSTAATLTVNSGTFATAAGAYVLPAAPAVGDLVEVVCITTGIVVTANTGQKIQLGTDVTSLAGTFTNSAKGDVLMMRYRATDAIWYCTSSNGVWVSA